MVCTLMHGGALEFWNKHTGSIPLKWYYSMNFYNQVNGQNTNINQRSPTQECPLPKSPNQPPQAVEVCISTLNRNWRIWWNELQKRKNKMIFARRVASISHNADLSNPCRRTTGIVLVCSNGFTQLLMIDSSEKLTWTEYQSPELVIGVENKEKMCDKCSTANFFINETWEPTAEPQRVN